jgi:trk system potassium uptake protein TrkA
VRAIVVGSGRVGSSLARDLADAGWDVVVVDRNPDAVVRLGRDWGGEFVAGHGMDADVLARAGVQDADALVAVTSGDNTNIVVAQVAQRRYEIPIVAARILDPARAEFYSGRGFEVISPTKAAIQDLAERVTSARSPS